MAGLVPVHTGRYRNTRQCRDIGKAPGDGVTTGPVAVPDTRLLLVPRAPARPSWRCRSGGKYYGPREATRNWHEVPFLQAFRDATGAENRMPPGGSKRTCRGKWPGFAGFQAQNPDGKYYWTPVLRHLWAWRYWRTGKILCVSPHAAARPKGPKDQRPPGLRAVRLARSATVLRLWCDAQSSRTFVRSSGAPPSFSSTM